ncbi:unnamed protein product [Sphagnum jensenii]|uniref:SOUL heme-binding protein n=1 Tax=Sphagnum jensenii TaxID=128206 RepID=A0ABP0WBB9_9BRYO
MAMIFDMFRASAFVFVLLFVAAISLEVQGRDDESLLRLVASASSSALTVGGEETRINNRAFESRKSSDDSCGPQISIETPACDVVGKGNGYELRKYPDAQIWVETLVENSTYNLATSIGFVRCFLFISGGNSKNMEIEMTGPVHITPVLSEAGYKTGFFVPSRFKSVNDLPTPRDPKIKFNVHKEAVMAVIGPFGGFPGDFDYEAEFSQLKKYLDKDGLKYDESSAVFAGYSSPFEIRNRQQEVHVKIVS